MKKKIALFISIFLAVLILFFCFYCLHLTDENINGFTGMSGIIRLSGGEDYTKLTDEPLQVIFKNGNLNTFENGYFDTLDENSDHPAWKHGFIDGIRYEYKLRAFTRYYMIATISETPE